MVFHFNWSEFKNDLILVLVILALVILITGIPASADLPQWYDPLNWTRVSTAGPYGNDYRMVFFEGDLYALSEGTGTVKYSGDYGRTWSTLCSGGAGDCLAGSMTFEECYLEYDGYLWSLGNEGIYNSANAVNWSFVHASPISSIDYYQCVVFDNKMWILAASGGLGKVYYSTDGSTWTLTSSALMNTVACAAVYGDYILAISTNYVTSRLYYSSDGITWGYNSIVNAPNLQGGYFQGCAVNPITDVLYASSRTGYDVYATKDLTNWVEVSGTWNNLSYAWFTTMVYNPEYGSGGELLVGGGSRPPGTYYTQVGAVPLYGGDPSIQGHVYDAFTGDVIEDAHVGFLQDSAYSNTTTNATGYYLITDLLVDLPISMDVGASGYYNASWLFTPQAETNYTVDWYLVPDLPYPILGVVYDVTDHSPISGALVRLEGVTQEYTDYYTTSSTGFFYFDGVPDENYTYTVTATKSGYYDKMVQFNTSSEESTVVYVPMYPGTSSSDGGAGISYPPHVVKFVVKSMFGQPKIGVNVTCQGFETTAGAWEWITSLLGMDTDAAPLHNASMTGQTGNDGAIDFWMVETVKYDCTFINATQSINETLQLYPKDDYYLVYVSESFFEGGCDALADLNLTVTGTEVDADDAFINVTYNDTLEGTTGVTVTVFQQDSAGNLTEVDNTTSSADAFTYNFSIEDQRGESYLVRFEIEHEDCGEVVRDYTVSFRPGPVTLGIPEDLLLWVAMFLIMFTALVFGGVSVGAGSVVVCIEGWIFWAMRWLDDLGLMAPMALALATCLAIAVNFMFRAKRVRYE